MIKYSIKELISSIRNNYDDIKYDIITNSINHEKALKNIDIKNIDKNGSYINIEFNKLKFENIISFTSTCNVKIIVYSYDKLFETELNKIVKRINTMIKTFNTFEKKDIEIYLYLYNCPRIITEEYIDNSNEFNDFNINDLFNCVNGYYQNRKEKHKILITRLNTYKGLLTHELCHLCKLDFGGYETFSKWEDDKKDFNITNESYFTEGINNAISSIIHSIFIALENGGDFKTEFSKTYYCEYKYSKDMVGNLLHYFKCKTISELKNHNYNQVSMVFEYVILRYIYLKYLVILYHLDKNYSEDEYYELFMKCLNNEKDKEIIFNNKMIIKDTNTNVNLVRMEYYLF